MILTTLIGDLPYVRNVNKLGTCVLQSNWFNPKRPRKDWIPKKKVNMTENVKQPSKQLGIHIMTLNVI